jgi:hypothetical protein
VKTIKIYKVTNLALDVLRTAIEIQFGKRVHFVDTILDIRTPEFYAASEGRAAWESKNQSVGGTVLVGEDLMELTTDTKVELSSFGGYWHGLRIFFGLRNLTRENGCQYYAAHCEYKERAPSIGDLRYPTVIRVKQTHTRNEDAEWHCGSGLLDVVMYPSHDPYCYRNHPLIAGQGCL